MFFIVFRIIRGLLSSRVLSIWFFLELRTVSFLLGLMFLKHKIIFKETIKLFLIQALRGISILLLILFLEVRSSYLIIFFLWLIVLFKISAVPFHSWFLNLRNKISWERILLFLTAIKFIPLIILSRVKRDYTAFFAVLSFSVARIRRLYYTRVKNLIVLSSLYFLGILFFTFNVRNFWLDMILVYRILFLPLFFIFRNRNNIFYLSSWTGGLSTLIVFLLIIRLAGLPPFPGFFLKYIWLVESRVDFLSLVVFFVRSGFIIYLYIRFSLKNLLEFSNQLLVNRPLIKTSFVFFWFSIIPSYTATYFCY